MNRLASLSLVLLFAASLSACGKRGPLEPPPGQAAQQKAAQHQGKTAGSAAQPGASSDSAGTTRLGTRKRVPITAPKRDLFIDRLLD